VNKTDTLYTDRNNNQWYCMSCMESALPFNHYDDDNDFVKACSETIENRLSLKELILNPFDLNTENEDDPLQDIDPDLHYFHDSVNTSIRCNYYSEENFVKKCSDFKIKNDNFSLFHINIRSVSKNFCELQHYLQSLNYSFDVIGLSETWLKDTTVNNFYHPGYKAENSYRTNKAGGGVSLLINESKEYVVRTDLCVYNECTESLFIEMQNSKKKTNIIIGVVYRPPNTNVNDFIQAMTEILFVIKKENKQCYIMGDTNINLLNVDNHVPTSDFLEMWYTYSFFPLITKPTRVTPNSATLIDNIFCNINPDRLSLSGIFCTDISDHFPVFHIDLSVTCNIVNSKIQAIRELSERNINKFTTRLDNVDWSQILGNNSAQQAYTYFHNVITEHYDECFPVKKIKSVYKTRKPWLTAGLKDCIKVKNKLYTRYLKYPSNYNRRIYKQYKGKLCSVLRNCERQYYDSVFTQNKNNSQKSWKIIKEVLNKNKCNSIPNEFNIDGKTVSDCKTIADRFNKFYVNIGPSLAKDIPHTNEDPLVSLSNINCNSIFLTNTDATEVLNIIKSLKISCPGWDNISSKVIKQSADKLLQPLVHVLNLSLCQGKVPRELKIARVTPIYKNGDQKLINNYRPVSILPCLSKILEKLFYTRLNTFINKHNILYDHQFGFREKHGTSLALCYLVDNIITSYEKNQSVLGVFIDFSKAFDTINHDILIRKLEAYGIRGIASKWIRSYLCNRSQYVCYNGINSDYENVKCGVPQGSILGPLLFLLYINDIANISSKLLPILFADDTNVFMSGKNIDEMIVIMNEELSKLVKWLHINKLSLNVKKTHYVIFRPGKCTIEATKNLYINGQKINREEYTTFLGVKLDSRLSWSQHIAHIKMKMAKNIGILCKARKVFKLSTMISLYYAFIYPYISYCIEIWGTAAVKHIEPIYKLQKLCCRIMMGSSPRTKSRPLFQLLNVMTIHDVYKYCVTLQMFKFYQGNLPRAFNDIFKWNSDISVRNTRQSKFLYIPLCKSNLVRNSFRYKGVEFWNQICNNKIETQCSYQSFKANLRKYIMSE